MKQFENTWYVQIKQILFKQIFKDHLPIVVHVHIKISESFDSLAVPLPVEFCSRVTVYQRWHIYKFLALSIHTLSKK
jgi:hypothetical protein